MIAAVTQIRLEKAASDNGFDLALDTSVRWICFGSSHTPLKLWLTVIEQAQFVAAFSDSGLATGLTELATIIQMDLPTGATTTFSVTDLKLLYPLLRRAFQLSRALPNVPLDEFKKATRDFPRSTDAERLVIQRVGQDIFRSSLVDYWDGKCAVTGLTILELLKASHIKPWKDCISDAERLDVFNGLLLAPHLDATFDRGFITFEDDGSIVISSSLDNFALEALGITKSLKVQGMTEAHRKYFKWHREEVYFRN